MTKKDLLDTEIGVYKCTDSINNYSYTLSVSKDGDGKCYSFKETGSLSNNRLFLTEDISKDDNGKEYKSLYAILTMGGISVHTEETYGLLNELKFI